MIFNDKQKMYMKKILILWAVLCCVCTATLQAQQRFSFHKDGKFKIAQFTDLHWTPRSAGCAETRATILSVLKTERPDLAILTGDVVTDAPALEGWKSVVQLFNDARMPFVVLMGNHDAEYLSKDSIYDFLQQSPYYVGERGPRDIQGCGNGVLPVYASNNPAQVAALLYYLDSNDYPSNQLLYGAYDWVHFDQIAWYRRQSTSFTQANGGKPLPALAFFHIPLHEYKDIVGDGKTYGIKNEGIASSDINSGLFASFLEMGDVMGAFVGHDHDNDFLGIYKNVLLAFGRVTGKDAYGDLKRGARIIELCEGQRRFDTWITTPAGREATYYYPFGLSSEDEQRMDYLPALDVNPVTRGVAYTYYEGPCKRVADIAALKPLKRGTMSHLSIDDAPAKDHFAYEFRTLIQIPERGVYRFYSYTDDGSVLYIDGQTIVDNDGGHSATRAEGKVALEKGWHELRLLYFEDYMGEELEVGFSGKNIPEKVLSGEMLFLPR